MDIYSIRYIVSVEGGKMAPRGGARKGAGRKPRGPEKLSSLLKVLLMPMDRERLEETAQKQRKPPSELARELILDGLKKIKRGKIQ